MVGKRVSGFQERKFREIVRQRTDFSCGAAAVATIFNYAYGRTTSETQILVNMLRVADQRIVRARGFSLLDIKRYVEAIGWRGEGYQVPFETLYELKVPAIVLLDTRGYKHFVVLRKARDGYVQLADPALGNRIMWREDFEPAWNGIVFAILGEGYNEKNILSNPPEPLSARRLYALNSPVFDAEVYDFGLRTGRELLVLENNQASFAIGSEDHVQTRAELQEERVAALFAPAGSRHRRACTDRADFSRSSGSARSRAWRQRPSRLGRRIGRYARALSNEKRQFLRHCSGLLFQTADGLVLTATLQFEADFNNGQPLAAPIILADQHDQNGIDDPGLEIGGITAEFTAQGLSTVDGAVQANQIGGDDNDVANLLRIRVGDFDADSAGFADYGDQITQSVVKTFQDGSAIEFTVEPNSIGIAIQGPTSQGQSPDNLVAQSINGSVANQIAQQVQLMGDANAVYNTLDVVIGVDQLQTTQAAVENAVSVMKGWEF